MGLSAICSKSSLSWSGNCPDTVDCCSRGTGKSAARPFKLAGKRSVGRVCWRGGSVGWIRRETKPCRVTTPRSARFTLGCAHAWTSRACGSRAMARLSYWCAILNSSQRNSAVWTFSPPGNAQGYAQCFEAFVADTYATIRGETRDGLPTFDDGLRSACIVEAVLKSSGTASWTPIEH